MFHSFSPYRYVLCFINLYQNRLDARYASSDWRSSQFISRLQVLADPILFDLKVLHNSAARAGGPMGAMTGWDSFLGISWGFVFGIFFPGAHLGIIYTSNIN